MFIQKFIVPQIDTIPSKVEITGQDAWHICKVLRYKKGGKIKVCDGKGKDFVAKISFVSSDKIKLDIIEQYDSNSESFIDITLCSAMLKDRKMDLIIKNITQLGVKKWIPFFSERCIPKFDVKGGKIKKKRWEKIAKESLKQCQRSFLPLISEPLMFEDLLKKVEYYDLKIAFWEESKSKLNIEVKKTINKVVILIGPEGGFSKAEISLAESKGFISCSLGPRLLKAETAAVASLTIIQHVLGDM